MAGFYDDEEERNEKISTKKDDHKGEDLPVKWKEAFSQIDYGIDVESSTVYMFGDIAEGTLYDLVLRIRAVLHMRDEAKKNDAINIDITSI